eukprot:Skav227452  [mRNA]  locus=scaffold2491:144404:144658:- [translate_table: standard]
MNPLLAFLWRRNQPPVGHSLLEPLLVLARSLGSRAKLIFSKAFSRFFLAVVVNPWGGATGFANGIAVESANQLWWQATDLSRFV